MNTLLRVTFLGVLLCCLACTWGRSIRSDRWSSLDHPDNREAFLSALQSYFSNKGIHIDRAAPAFIVMSTNTRKIRNPRNYDRVIAVRERNLYEAEKDVQEGEFY